MVFDGDFLGEPEELTGFTEVTGSVNLNQIEATTLAGMECLQTVGGSFFVFESPNVTTLDGLGPVEVVSSLGIELNPELTDIGALAHLKEVPMKLRVVNNPKLESLDSLAGVVGAVTDVEIWDNPQIATVGLGGVESVANTLSVQRNESLSSLAFDSLSTVAWLLVRQNGSLANLSGLEGLTTAEFGVAVVENPMLTDVSGLLTAKLVHLESEIEIHDNVQLPQCAAVALADALKPAGWAGTEDVTNNMGTCP